MDTELRMYILIKDVTPPDIVPLISAHVAMGTYRMFKDRPMMRQWCASPLFKKVVCKVTPEQFEQAKQYGAYWALTEDKRRELGELGLGFDVLQDYPRFLKFLSLYKVKGN